MAELLFVPTMTRGAGIYLLPTAALVIVFGSNDQAEKDAALDLLRTFDKPFIIQCLDRFKSNIIFDSPFVSGINLDEIRKNDREILLPKICAMLSV